MGFEPTTLRDLAGCSNHWATAVSMVSKGEMWVFDWKHIVWLDSQMMTRRIWTHNCIMQSPWGISKMRTNHPTKWV